MFADNRAIFCVHFIVSYCVTRGMHGEFPAGMWAAIITGPAVVPLCKGISGRGFGARPIGVGRSAPGALFCEHISIYCGKG